MNLYKAVYSYPVLSDNFLNQGVYENKYGELYIICNNKKSLPRKMAIDELNKKHKLFNLMDISIINYIEDDNE